MSAASGERGTTPSRSCRRSPRDWGGQGADAIDGGAGDDVLAGGEGPDELAGGPGADTLIGGLDADQLIGDTGTDTLWGGAGDDQLDGGDDADVILPGSGDNLVLGGAGDDTLVVLHACELENGTSFDGGAGHDVLLLPPGVEPSELVAFALDVTDVEEFGIVDAASYGVSDCDPELGELVTGE